MDDLVDFIAELRDAIGPDAPLTVLLAGPPAGGGMGAVASGVADVWQSKLATLADPWIAIEILGGTAP